MTTHRNHRLVRIVTLGLLIALLTPLTAGAAIDVDREPGSPVRLSNQAVAITLVRSVFNGGDTGSNDTLISPDATIHTPYGEFTGPAGLQDYLEIVRARYSDAWFEIISTDVDDDTVVIRWAMTTSRYIPPSSRPVDVQVSGPGVTTITVADGEIVELTQSWQEPANMTINGVSVADEPME